MEPGQFTLISMGLSRYSCRHISGGPHKPIPTKFGLWMFFIMLHRDMVSKTLKCEKKVFCDVIASVLYTGPVSFEVAEDSFLNIFFSAWPKITWFFPNIVIANIATWRKKNLGGSPTPPLTPMIISTVYGVYFAVV